MSKSDVAVPDEDRFERLRKALGDEALERKDYTDSDLKRMFKTMRSAMKVLGQQAVDLAIKQVKAQDPAWAER